MVSVISLTAFGKSPPNSFEQIAFEGAQRYLKLAGSSGRRASPRRTLSSMLY